MGPAMETCLRCGWSVGGGTGSSAGSANEPNEQASCSACGARLTGGVDWCTMCFAPVNAPAPVSVGGGGLSSVPWSAPPAVAPPAYWGEAPPPARRPLHLASSWQRFKAAFVDGFMSLLWSICVGLSVAVFKLPEAVMYPLAYGFVAWNQIYLPTRHGQSIGKRKVGIAVEVDGTREAPSLARNLAREVVKYFLPLYFLVWFHPKRKHLGDMVAGTVVATCK